MTVNDRSRSALATHHLQFLGDALGFVSLRFEDADVGVGRVDCRFIGIDLGACGIACGDRGIKRGFRRVVACSKCARSLVVRFGLQNRCLGRRRAALSPVRWSPSPP